MSEFDSLESLEAPKIVKTRKPRTPKVDYEAGANASPGENYNVKEDLFDLTFLEEELLEKEAPVAKRGKGRPKKVVEPVAEDEQDASPPKPKRVQTEAQKLNFIKALEVRKKNIELRKQAKELEKQVKEAELESKKKEIERKVIKKAVVLKKREILEQTALDDISDTDDIPDEVVQKIVKKQRAKATPKPKQVVIQEPVAPPTPKYNFV